MLIILPISCKVLYILLQIVIFEALKIVIFMLSLTDTVLTFKKKKICVMEIFFQNGEKYSNRD